jgi:hypothetical protein
MLSVPRDSISLAKIIERLFLRISRKTALSDRT